MNRYLLTLVSHILILCLAILLIMAISAILLGDEFVEAVVNAISSAIKGLIEKYI